MRGWWQEIAGLVLPVDCAGCGRPRAVLCEACAVLLRGDGGVARRVSPWPRPAGLPEVYAAAVYADGARAVLLAHKERGGLGLARPLGEALARGVRRAWAGGEGGGGVPVGDGSAGGAQIGGIPAGVGVPAGGDRVRGDQARGVHARGVRARGVQVDGIPAGAEVVLVPVPSARRAVAARGQDPLRRIALAAAGVLRGGGVRCRVLPVLRQRRPVADQSGLTAAQRRRNLAGALEAVPGAGRLPAPAGALGERRIVIVDDLMTTGASLAEAARALRTAGVPVAGAAVVAAARSVFDSKRN